jgi:hypothetical protein
MTSDLQKRFKLYGAALDEDQKVCDMAFAIDKKTTQLAKKMVFAVHRHGTTKNLEQEILREFSRVPPAARFRYGHLLANAREEYLEAVLLREFVRQVEETWAGTRDQVTLTSIIRMICSDNCDNNETREGEIEHFNNHNFSSRGSSYSSNGNSGNDYNILAGRLGDDDRAAETLLLALLDFSGELARLGTIETARFGWAALVVAQDLLWHSRQLAPYADDAGVRRFDKKLATLAISVGKLERLLTLTCMTTPQTMVAPLSGGAKTADPVASESAAALSSGPAPRPPGAFSMVDIATISRFQNHSL